MDIREITDQNLWDAFLIQQEWSPFLQSYTMGEVYRDVGQEPVRFGIFNGNEIVGICFGHLVPARRGRHLSIPYGPIISPSAPKEDVLRALLPALKDAAKKKGAKFLRISPFWKLDDATFFAKAMGAKKSPMHLLAEHLWLLPLEGKTADTILAEMRKTTRNLVRRAERDGVTIRAAESAEEGLGQFIRLHEETRQRHHFTPYTTSFFKAQVERFMPQGNVTIYLAEFEGQVIASSIHMHFGGETSYHHGASAGAFSKVPSSYLLQWTAIQDSLKRGDHIYNFWGIAPENHDPKHPFAGITTFKTGFGGQRHTLMPCMDVPLHPAYHATRALEHFRRLRRGF